MVHSKDCRDLTDQLVRVVATLDGELVRDRFDPFDLFSDQVETRIHDLRQKEDAAEEGHENELFDSVRQGKTSSKGHDLIPD